MQFCSLHHVITYKQGRVLVIPDELIIDPLSLIGDLKPYVQKS